MLTASAGTLQIMRHRGSYKQFCTHHCTCLQAIALDLHSNHTKAYNIKLDQDFSCYTTDIVVLCSRRKYSRLTDEVPAIRSSLLERLITSLSDDTTQLVQLRNGLWTKRIAITVAFR